MSICLLHVRHDGVPRTQKLRSNLPAGGSSTALRALLTSGIVFIVCVCVFARARACVRAEGYVCMCVRA